MPSLLPYAALLFAIMLSPLRRRWIPVTAFGLATAAGLAYGRLDFVALPGLVVMAGLAYAARGGRPALEILAFAWALILSNYLWPGFRNLPIFDRIQFSPDASPFTMYLNFDKTAAGFWLYLYVVRRPPWGAGVGLIARTWFAVTATLMAVAIATGYVRFDVKWPDGGTIWAVNNLFFVCLAEEAVFRGLLQARLTKWLGQTPAIALAALAFGLQHYRGGPPYVALATLAGLFYGYAYARTGRLEASMLVHFGLNLTHFVFFTYPSLIP